MTARRKRMKRTTTQSTPTTTATLPAALLLLLTAAMQRSRGHVAAATPQTLTWTLMLTLMVRVWRTSDGHGH
jgi:hypothetical protein